MCFDRLRVFTDAATQPPLAQIVDGAPLIETLRTTGYKVNWDATFWWPYLLRGIYTSQIGPKTGKFEGFGLHVYIARSRYIMMIAPTIATPDNFTEPWGSSFDMAENQTGYNNRLSTVHIKSSYALREAALRSWA